MIENDSKMRPVYFVSMLYCVVKAVFFNKTSKIVVVKISKKIA